MADWAGKFNLLNALKSQRADGPILWLNEHRVTVSIGKRYEQKGDLEKAANCYEKVLTYAPDDVKTRVRLSRCYQKMLQHKQAEKHHNHAKQKGPNQLQTLENDFSMNFELGNYEASLNTYNKYYKQLKTSETCYQGLLKVYQVMKDSLPLGGMMKCLESEVLNMIKNEAFFNDEPFSEQFPKNRTKLNAMPKNYKKRLEEAYYLRNISTNLDFYRKQLNDVPQKNASSKLISEQIQNIVHTFEKAKEDLYNQKPFYMVLLYKSKHHLNDRRKVKDMMKLQIAKYIHMVVTHCLAGEIRQAQRQAELAMKYMEKQRYTPIRIVNIIFEVIGLGLYSVNQDVPEWSDELNHRRLLYLLGLKTDENETYNKMFEESYFGPSNYNARNILKNVSKQLNETELSTYRLNLQYEKLKCYIKLKKYGPVRMLSHEMFTDAYALGSIAWQMNALIMSVISESRARVQVSQLMKCMETLEFMLPISKALGDKNVTEFLTKMWDLFAEDNVEMSQENYEAKRKEELIEIMPDLESTITMRNLLYRIEKLPGKCRLPLLLNDPHVFKKCNVVLRGEPCGIINVQSLS